MSANKSFSTETSERYARALYEVSKESSDLEKIESDVKNFQSLFENNPEIKNFIQNPTYVIETQNKVLNILSEKLDFTKNLKNFFLLLIKKRRMFFIKKITTDKKSDFVSNYSLISQKLYKRILAPRNEEVKPFYWENGIK